MTALIDAVLHRSCSYNPGGFIRTLIVATALLLVASTPAWSQTSNDECLACHEDAELTKEVEGGPAVSVHTDPAKFGFSVHAPFGCTDCHADITGYPHESVQPVDCASCHPDSVAAWESSLHAKSANTGIAHAAQCADCHGHPHEILPSSDPNSKTAHGAIPATCASCHAQKFVMDEAGLRTQAAISYQDSVHGRAVALGSARAAVCTDCHDYHAVRPANDPMSGIFKFNVGRTCGQCHASVASQYADSIHGTALARGSWSSPVCTDCHGIHSISVAGDQLMGPSASCARCHEEVRLTREFGVAAQRVASFEKSYHGLARRMGSTVAADCASCHTAHHVLPSSDPRSAIHPQNLQKTCGECHEGAQENFTRGKVHRVAGDMSDTPSKIITWIGRIYIVLIFVTIGSMLLHNLLIWVKKARVAKAAHGPTVVRMNRNQRIQHAVMVLSFVVLVISGFALAWPESFFAWFFGPNEEIRRIVHRVAGVIMIIIGFYHLAYMLFTREGRNGLREFWFRLSDARDLMTILRYSLGLTKDKPQYGRFSYAEKIEYWAMMWGTIVMAITGLMILYFVEVATWIPRWWIDIATTIHFYEAILATLAIIVWHFYHVIFDPDVYPMNWAWFDGTMPKEQYEEEHGRDVEHTEVPPANEGKES